MVESGSLPNLSPATTSYRGGLFNSQPEGGSGARLRRAQRRALNPDGHDIGSLARGASQRHRIGVPPPNCLHTCLKPLHPRTAPHKCTDASRAAGILPFKVYGSHRVTCILRSYYALCGSTSAADHTVPMIFLEEWVRSFSTREAERQFPRHSCPTNIFFTCIASIITANMPVRLAHIRQD